MKLYELFDSGKFDKSDPIRVATTAILSQMKADIDDSAYKGKFTVKALLNKLHDNGVKISHARLLELVKEEPWSNLISNVKGDEVKFKGEPDEHSSSEEPDDTTDTLDKMADRAAKKNSNPFK